MLNTLLGLIPGAGGGGRRVLDPYLGRGEPLRV